MYIVYKNKNTIEGLYTVNGRMSIDSQYFYNKLFDNVIYYHNTYNKKYNTGEDIGKLLKTGWQSCLEQCPGHCVEYGPTGRSYCFYPEGINARTLK